MTGKNNKKKSPSKQASLTVRALVMGSSIRTRNTQYYLERPSEKGSSMMLHTAEEKTGSISTDLLLEKDVAKQTLQP